MIDQASVPSLMGSTVRDNSGDKIGKVGQVYLDDTTGRPEWVTVKTGLFGTRESFVPLAAAHVDGDELVVDVPKSRVTDAPKIDEDGHLSEEQETELYSYYGVSQGDFGRSQAERESDVAGTTTTGYDDGGQAVVDGSTGFAAGQVPATGTTDFDTTDRATGIAPSTADTDYDRGTDHDRTDTVTGTSGTAAAGTAGIADRGTDDAMTRSEEHLVAGTERVDAGRARLRKYVVTDTEQVEVPVRHEEVVLEREPITEGNRGAAYSGQEISEDEHEVTLRAERPVVSTETEAVERVRLGKETVQDTETVSGEVRKEQIEFEDGTGTSRDRNV
jgi:uncharacterized protein (TIGR02271 family)